ncbi:LysM peptidoglycan-binding domain-containing protein [Vibrio gigantis]
MKHLVITFNVLICLTFCGSAIAEELNSHRFGVGASYGYNFDGDMYENSQSLQLIYQYNRIQVNLGGKHYKLEGTSEYIPDISALYSVHDGDILDLKVGFGFEDKYPTVEYVVDYALTKNLGATISLNQTLNDDFGQNQREAVLGLAYYFYESRMDHELKNIEPRPYSLDNEDKSQCLTLAEEGDCSDNAEPKTQPKEKPTTKVNVKPNLPYVVQEGDWLYKICRDYGFDYKEIIENNNISNPDLIYPGQVLR